MMFLQNIVKSRLYGTKAREKSVDEKLDPFQELINDPTQHQQCTFCGQRLHVVSKSHKFTLYIPCSDGVVTTAWIVYVV